MKKRKNLPKLQIMVIVYPNGKRDLIYNQLENYDVTIILNTLAKGTLIQDVSKEVLFCAIKEDLVKDAILMLEDLFSKFHSNISMVYTIPMNSIIGVSSYMSLAKGVVK